MIICIYIEEERRNKLFLDSLVQISSQIYGKVILEKSACWQGLLSLFTKSDSENFKTVGPPSKQEEAFKYRYSNTKKYKYNEKYKYKY